MYIGNGTIDIHVEVVTLLVWIIVGLVAGFLASRVMLGFGLGLVGDLIAGIVGAILGGYLAGVFGVRVEVADHPVVSQILIAFVGALVVLLVLRVFGLGRSRRRAAL